MTTARSGFATGLAAAEVAAGTVRVVVVDGRSAAANPFDSPSVVIASIPFAARMPSSKPATSSAHKAAAAPIANDRTGRRGR